MTDPTDLIGEIVDVELGGRTVDAVVKDVEPVYDRLEWRDEITIVRNGSQWRVPPTAIIS